MPKLTLEQIDCIRRIGRNKEADNTTIALPEFDALCDTAEASLRRRPGLSVYRQIQNQADEVVALQGALFHFTGKFNNFQLSDRETTIDVFAADTPMTPLVAWEQHCAARTDRVTIVLFKDYCRARDALVSLLHNPV